VAGAPPPAAAPRVPAAVEDEIEDETTNPVTVGAAARAAAAEEVDEDVETVTRRVPESVATALGGGESGGGGLADLLEPDAPGAAPPVHELVDDAAPQAVPAAEPEPAAPQVATGVGPEPVMLDDEPRGRSFPIFWIVLVLMLGGALAWVVFTQTDLRFGDVVAKRDSDAEKQAEEERAAAIAKAEASKKEYGTIAVNSDPDGAQVFMFKPGPSAVFENLPRAHEYLLLVEAPGQLPEVRRIKGTEIAGKLVVDLDAAPNPERAYPIPETEPPEVADDADLEDTVNLEVESPDENARFGLLVGYTPGVRLVDLEAAETHELLVYKPGYEPHGIVVKGRHWEETPDGLIYSETVSLQVAEPMPEDLAEGETEGDLMLGDETGGEEMAETGEVVEEPPPAPKPKKRKKKKKKKKKR
jgi:hypothetical protein